MPDVREVFDMATQKVRPEPGALERQFRGQRQRSSRRRAGAYAAVAAVVIAGLVLALVLSNDQRHDRKVSNRPTPTPTATAAALGASGRITSIVDLRGHVLQDVPGVSADAWEPALSPDGTRLAYMTFDNTKGFCGGCAGGVARMAMVGVDGTHSEYVTEFAPAGLVRPMMPAISPDGTRVAFAATRKGNIDIYVIDAPGSPLNTSNLHFVRLTIDPGDDEFPAWTPDGKSIVYVNSGRTRLDGNALSPTEELWEISATGGTPVRLTHNDVPDNSPSVSPDGTEVAMFEDGAIDILDLATGRVRSAGVDGWSPRWSPDGTKLAFLDFGAGRLGATWDPFHAPGGYSGPQNVTFNLGDVKILDLGTGNVTNTHVQVLTEWNAVSWLPSGDALLVNRYIR